MSDPRPSVFVRRLAPLRRVVAVGGGKGGVGKTTVASLLALNAARAGASVGLLDLDIHGAAAHLILGVEPCFPEEEGGILPLPGPLGISFMSATAFSAHRPLALRGPEVSDAIAELLAVTIWPELDLLLIDLPPGLGESLLDVLRFIPQAAIIAVTTPSAPSISVADRFLSAVRGQADLVGVVANLVGAFGREGAAASRLSSFYALTKRHSTELLATVPIDGALEAAAGNPGALLSTDAASALSGLIHRLSVQDAGMPRKGDP